MPLLRIKRVGGSLTRLAKLQIALLTIVLQQCRTEDLGKITCGITPGSIHLPQTVLRSNESLSIKEVVKGSCANVRHTEFVANDSYWTRKPTQRNAAIHLRQP